VSGQQVRSWCFVRPLVLVMSAVFMMWGMIFRQTTKIGKAKVRCTDKVVAVSLYRGKAQYYLSRKKYSIILQYHFTVSFV